jgi:hypothetical protein
MLDFTVKSYRLLLESLILNGYSCDSYVDFIENKSNSKKVILRHDVDAKKQNSLAFAKIQHSLGAKGTYYFRTVPESYDVKVINEIACLGHEIGYHYETMDTQKGNLDKAYDEFCLNLEMFRKIVPIKTSCMHGSPLSKFDNREIWTKYDYRSLGLIGEPYFDIDFNKVYYLTDTGRRWDGEKVSVRDKARKENPITNPDFLKFNFNSTFQIIEALENNQLPNQIMMTFHPQRWDDNILEWSKEFILQNAKNIIKSIIVKTK